MAPESTTFLRKSAGSGAECSQQMYFNPDNQRITGTRKTLSCWHHLQRKTGIKAALIYPKYTGYLVIFCLWSKSKEYIIRTISYINHHSRLFRVHTYWCHMGRQSLDSSNSSETPSPRKSSLQLPNVPMWSRHLWCQPCHLLNHGKSNSIL